MASINYSVGSNWGSGFVGNMTVPGGTDGLHGWLIEFDASFAISNIWGAEIVSHAGNHYVIRNAAWNADVPTGGQASFGFQATPGATGTAASGFVVNGAGTPVPPVLPTLTVDDASIGEGNSGTAQLTFTVKLSQASTGPVTVQYSTADGTATAGSDYTARTGTLTFAVGETSKTITVPILGDTAVEANEAFTIALSGASGATIADGSAVGTITNDDVAPPLTPPTLAIGDATFAEGSAVSPGLATFTVTLSAASATPVTVSYATANGAAKAGSDYVAKSGTLTFAAGETQKTIQVAAIGDAVVEANEGFTVVLKNPVGATLADGTGAGTITNDDTAPPPTIAIGDAIFAEGSAAAPGRTTFTVTLSAASATPVTVNYATANGTATAGSDYVAKSGTLTFAAGETQKTIQVAAIGDAVAEANEGFTVVLTNPVGATLADGVGAGTITNDDAVPPPTLAIGDATFAEGSAAAPGHGTFTVTLSTASATPVTVSYTTANGTATAGSDYVAKSGTLTFAAGETQKTIQVTAIGDAVVEANEGFTVVLTNPSGATLADGTGAGTITNDDVVPPPTLAIGDSTFAEGSAAAPGHATFTVTLSAASATPVTVSYATANGTATAASDYVAQSGTLTFAAGETQKTIQVTAIGDAVVEANEGFTVLDEPLANAGGAGRLVGFEADGGQARGDLSVRRGARRLATEGAARCPHRGARRLHRGRHYRALSWHSIQPVTLTGC